MYGNLFFFGQGRRTKLLDSGIAVKKNGRGIFTIGADRSHRRLAHLHIIQMHTQYICETYKKVQNEKY